MQEEKRHSRGSGNPGLVSSEALDLIRSSDVIDLHVDSFIWTRAFGYDLSKRHGCGLFRGRYYSQADLPRLGEAGVSGAIWSITTNPLRRESSRPRILRANHARLRRILESCRDQVGLARNAAEYREVRNSGRHAAFLGIQGGNAMELEGALEPGIQNDILKVTLVHLTNSSLGGTSSPLGGGRPGGLTRAGHEFIKRLDAHRIFVDLAHIHRNGFFEAAKAHDRRLPLIVSHTGVTGVLPHWRNIDDDQIRAVAETGGVIGVMYKTEFLGKPARTVRVGHIVDHLEHIIEKGGEETAALGSDWDGFIETPPDMRTCLEFPRLVQAMLDRRWKEDRIRKVLGANVLRAIAALRG